MSVPFKAKTVGMTDPGRMMSVPGAKRQDAMLRFHIRGRGVYRCRDGTEYPLIPGCMCMCPQGERGIHMCGSEDPYAYYYCRFGGDYALELAETIAAQRGIVFQVEDQAAVADQLLRLQEHRSPRKDNEDESMDQGDVILAELLVGLANRGEAPTDEKRRGKLSRDIILSYLNEHLNLPTDLQAIADGLGVSKTTLVRNARMLCGETVLQIHEEMKMDWAKTLLEADTLQVQDVAGLVGYSDPLYFSRVFHKHTGMSPTQWRSPTLDG